MWILSATLSRSDICEVDTYILVYNPYGRTHLKWWCTNSMRDYVRVHTSLILYVLYAVCQQRDQEQYIWCNVHIQPILVSLPRPMLSVCLRVLRAYQRISREEDVSTYECVCVCVTWNICVQLSETSSPFSWRGGGVAMHGFMRHELYVLIWCLMKLVLMRRVKCLGRRYECKCVCVYSNPTP